MKLSLLSDYALRLLMMLAANPDRLCTIAEAATRYGVSRNHMMKVAQILTSEGYAHSVRGRSGGLRLARPAAEIRIGDVLRHTEDFALLDCFGENGEEACILSPMCRLKGVLAEANAAFIAVLDNYTLADVTGNLSILRLHDSGQAAGLT